MTPIAIAGAVAAFLLLVVGAAFHRLLVDELVGLVPAISARLIDRAARRLHPSDRERYREEWAAELVAYRERRISGLIYALRLRVHAGTLRKERERAVPEHSRGAPASESYAGVLAAQLVLISFSGFADLARVSTVGFGILVLAFEGTLFLRSRSMGCAAADGRTRLGWLLAVVAGLCASFAIPLVPGLSGHPGRSPAVVEAAFESFSLVFVAILVEYYLVQLRLLELRRGPLPHAVVREHLRFVTKLGLCLRVATAWVMLVGMLAFAVSVAISMPWLLGRLLGLALAVGVTAALAWRKLPGADAVRVALHPPALLGDVVMLDRPVPGGPTASTPVVVCHLSVFGAQCRPASDDPRRDLQDGAPSIPLTLGGLRAARLVALAPHGEPAPTGPSQRARGRLRPSRPAPAPPARAGRITARG